jgi:hypothetical protein
MSDHQEEEQKKSIFDGIIELDEPGDVSIPFKTLLHQAEVRGYERGVKEMALRVKEIYLAADERHIHYTIEGFNKAIDDSYSRLTEE